MPFVIKYIATNWSKFTREFPDFCKNLLAAAENYSKEMGRTHLAHRDGLAAALSRVSEVFENEDLQKATHNHRNQIQSFFTRLLKHKGSIKLSDVEFTCVGKASLLLWEMR